MLLQMTNTTPPQQERTMNDRVNELEQGMELQRQKFESHRKKMEEYWRHSRENMIYMQEYIATLVQRFHSMSAEHMLFPVPIIWPEATLFAEEVEQEDNNDMVDRDSDEF